MGYVILSIQDDEMVLTLTYPDPHFHRCLSVCPHHSGPRMVVSKMGPNCEPVFVLTRHFLVRSAKPE